MSLDINSIEEYNKEYEYSVSDPEGFWASKAEKFSWRKKWDNVLKWDFNTPDVKWFEGGKLNITENCLDRHLAERGDDIAIIFEPNEFLSK